MPQEFWHQRPRAGQQTTEAEWRAATAHLPNVGEAMLAVHGSGVQAEPHGDGGKRPAVEQPASRQHASAIGAAVVVGRYFAQSQHDHQETLHIQRGDEERTGPRKKILKK